MLPQERPEKNSFNPDKIEMISGKTECGLRYAVKKSGSAVGYCALSIKCGTRDEEGYHSGIAHFTEHTIFKGTARRSAAVINGYLDRLGGELNATCSKVHLGGWLELCYFIFKPRKCVSECERLKQQG